MGTNNLSTIGASIVRAVGTQLDQYFTAITGVFVPRNSSGVPETNTQDLGSTTYCWKDTHQRGALMQNVFFKGAIVSFGNGKDGDASASDYTATGMGGEYWFDEFDIDADITVDDSIGWLVIRANTITVSKSGGAVIDGKGKSLILPTNGTSGSGSSVSATTPASDDILCGFYNIGGFGGNGGSGGNSGNASYGTGVSGDITIYSPLYDYQQGAVGAVAGSSDITGNSGDNGANAFFSINNIQIINVGVSGTGGTGGKDDGSTFGNGGNGGRGGAGIAIFCKTLVMTEDFDLDSRGDDGVNGTGGGGSGGGGGGGAGGAGNNIIAYITKSGIGTITQLASGGTGGSGGALAGDGGDGGDGLAIEIDINNVTIT
jgi:hypothetical protein